MRLYTRTGATALDDPEFGHIEADANGGFDMPDELSDRLHKFHIGGKPAWENDIERQNRLAAEELDRLRDPVTLLEAVRQVSGLGAAIAAAQTPPPAPVADAAPAAKTTRAKKSAPSSTTSS